MATSGSWDYSLTAANIISVALENIGATPIGATDRASYVTLCLRRLNMIAKQFQGTADGSQGIKVHTRQRVTMFLEKGQQTYLIGPASTDSKASTQYGRTTISANEAAGQTTISITSNTDTTTYPGTTVTMTASDVIGIVLDTGAIHWSTISGTPSTTATIVDALPSAAASGNYVYWFTSKAQRFPVIESAFLRYSSMTDTPMDIYTQVQQYDLGVSAKQSDGTPTCMLVEPLRTATRITLDRQPTDVTQMIVMTVLYPAEDYDTTADDIAFPQEWLRALAWSLSKEVAPAFSRQWTPEMEANRIEAVSIARGINAENSVLYFQSAA